MGTVSVRLFPYSDTALGTGWVRFGYGLYGFVQLCTVLYGFGTVISVVGPYLGTVWGTAMAVLGTVLGIWPKYGSPPSAGGYGQASVNRNEIPVTATEPPVTNNQASGWLTFKRDPNRVAFFYMAIALFRKLLFRKTSKKTL